mmetsp:Transcript_21253/g.58847  ORF Transcript_21253/g.58847 Transcript_21253/m.58847 type:complete len:456 (+) Transcript_21253:1014-2381(+)
MKGGPKWNRFSATSSSSSKQWRRGEAAVPSTEPQLGRRHRTWSRPKHEQQESLLRQDSNRPGQDNNRSPQNSPEKKTKPLPDSMTTALGSNTETKKHSTTEPFAQPSLPQSQTVSKRDPRQGKSSLQSAPISTAWKRIGTHQLVQSSQSNQPERPSNAVSSVPTDKDNPANPPQHHNHKPLLRSSRPALPLPVNQNHNQNNQDLKRVGRNKLLAVSSDKKEDSKKDALRKRNHHMDKNRMPRNAKRIRVVQPPTMTTTTAAAVAGQSLAPTTTSVQDEEKHDDGDTSHKAAVLTTFAYCPPTTTGVPTARRTRRADRNNNKNNNKSLVRVPTTNTTRICPLFAKGVDCTQPGCLLRHDVPSSAARPTCRHFLNHGSCLRGNDCPFRHVKGTAEPCPRWTATGYCTLEHCPLAHVQHKNKILHVVVGGSAGEKKKKDPMKEGTDLKDEKLLVFYDE